MKRSACPPSWAGVDVGGRRKGFHVAILVGGPGRLALAEHPRRLPAPADVAAYLAPFRPRVTGVDAPRSLADDPLRFAGERRLAREVCRVRYTPTAAGLARQKLGTAPTYYEWIEHGLELYDALAAGELDAIETFPTAAWTRWAGPRTGAPRARWSANALRRIASRGLHVRVPHAVLAQDERDAIGAAVTAWACDAGLTETFGTIVVPRPGWPFERHRDRERS